MKRASEKRGFTLVEIIVVLVILAVLAAILIPSYVKYIDRAKSKIVSEECHNIYVAAEASLAEQYGADPAYFKTLSRVSYNGAKIYGRVSDNMFYYVQNNAAYDDKEGKKIDAALAESILECLGSADKSTADYKFNNKTRPTTETITEYENLYDQPGIVIVYDRSAKVVFIEFGHDGYVGHMDKNGITITKDGTFTSTN